MMVVAISQPLNAFLRPHPDPKTLSRRVWEGIHKTSGYASVLISVWNAFVGLESNWWYGYESTHDVIYNVLWVLIGCVSLAAVALFILEARALVRSTEKFGGLGADEEESAGDMGLLVAPSATGDALLLGDQ